MLTAIQLFLGKNIKWVIAGAIFVAFLVSMYFAFNITINKIEKVSTEKGAVTERAITNEKVIEDVRKANDNANTPVDESRKHRLCEKYDRNRADCK